MKNKITVTSDLKELRNIWNTPRKKKQRKLLIQMMKEAEEDGLYAQI